MSLRKLPLFEDTFYQYSAILSNQYFVLEFRYMIRSDSWYLSVFDSKNRPVYRGAKIVLNFPILKNVPDFPGSIFIVSDQNIEPDKNLFKDFSLLYADGEDSLDFSEPITEYLVLKNEVI